MNHTLGMAWYIYYQDPVCIMGESLHIIVIMMFVFL